MEQLATQCPHCGTQFRVTLAQLELRDGKVRCGACREVFNGIDTVFEYSGESAPTSHPSDATQDFSNRMTLFDVGAAGTAPAASTGSNMQEELDALSRAIADLQSKPWAPTPSTPHSDLSEESFATAAASSVAASSSSAASSALPRAEHEAPGFVQQARQQQRVGAGWRALLWIGIPLLSLVLLMQLGWMFRHELAAHSPHANRLLRAVCARLHCEIKLPLNLEQLSVSASRLEQAPPPEAGSAAHAAVGENAMPMTLIALLQNTSDSVQTWPALELTLRDTDGTLLVKKVFTADAYVAPNELQAGMPARSEREIRLPLALTGEPPAGFAVSIFYP